MEKQKDAGRNSKGGRTSIPLEWFLSIDPGTHQAGVSLWHGEELVGHMTITPAYHMSKFTSRAATMRDKFEGFLKFHGCPPISKIIAEDVRNKVTFASIGALTSLPKLDCDIVYFPIQTWKKWARDHGCKEKDPKGVPALKAIGWPECGGLSDDVADSILIFHAYCARRGWLNV